MSQEQGPGRTSTCRQDVYNPARQMSLPRQLLHRETAAVGLIGSEGYPRNPSPAQVVALRHFIDIGHGSR